MSQFFLAIAAIFGGLSVAAGAFGSHALKEKLTDRALAIFETGTRYQMYHALALLLVALLCSSSFKNLPYEAPPPTLVAAGIAFIAGVVLFSGSLYTLSLANIKWMGAIAALGGAAFIIGWSCLAVTALSFK
jgi:uncharacterized membrane protein YgdD (TMEM256/DUF423 family)